MYRSIVVPLDGSDSAALAIQHAKELATRFEAAIHLVRAVPTMSELAETATPPLQGAAMSQDVFSRQDAAREQSEARDYLDGVRRKLESEGIKADARVASGVPAEQILETARSAAANLIVLTAYGAGGAHTRAERAVFGGVADDVLRQSHVPVLLVRP